MAVEREPLMSVTETARRLNVSVRTVRRLFERHELRGVRIGKQWRARAEDVERLATPADAPRTAESVELETARAIGVSTSTHVEPSIRIFRNRPWESETGSAASSAAGRARSAGKRKTASVSG